MAQTPTEAGQGESHVYRIAAANTADQEPLTASRDYLGIDALAWYVNKESSWFRDRTASGVLTATLAGGSEQYQAALGTFELDNGQKTAPVIRQTSAARPQFRRWPHHDRGHIDFDETQYGYRQSHQQRSQCEPRHHRRNGTDSRG